MNFYYQTVLGARRLLTPEQQQAICDDLLNGAVTRTIGQRYGRSEAWAAAIGRANGLEYIRVVKGKSRGYWQRVSNEGTPTMDTETTTGATQISADDYEALLVPEPRTTNSDALPEDDDISAIYRELEEGRALMVDANKELRTLRAELMQAKGDVETLQSQVLKLQDEVNTLRPESQRLHEILNQQKLNKIQVSRGFFQQAKDGLRDTLGIG